MDKAIFDEEEGYFEIKDVWENDGVEREGGLYLRLRKAIIGSPKGHTIINLEVVNEKGEHQNGGYLIQFDTVRGEFARFEDISTKFHIRLTKGCRVKLGLSTK